MSASQEGPVKAEITSWPQVPRHTPRTTIPRSEGPQVAVKSTWEPRLSPSATKLFDVSHTLAVAGKTWPNLAKLCSEVTSFGRFRQNCGRFWTHLHRPHVDEFCQIWPTSAKTWPNSTRSGQNAAHTGPFRSLSVVASSAIRPLRGGRSGSGAGSSWEVPVALGLGMGGWPALWKSCQVVCRGSEKRDRSPRWAQTSAGSSFAMGEHRCHVHHVTPNLGSRAPSGACCNNLRPNPSIVRPIPAEFRATGVWSTSHAALVDFGQSRFQASSGRILPISGHLLGQTQTSIGRIRANFVDSGPISGRGQILFTFGYVANSSQMCAE